MQVTSTNFEQSESKPIVSRLSLRVTEVGESIGTLAGRHPGITIGIAVATGVLLGWLIKRK